MINSIRTLNDQRQPVIGQFGPGYAASISDLEIESTSLDQLQINSDGTQLSFRPSADKEADLLLAFDDPDVSYKLVIEKADIGASQSVTVSLELGQLVFDNSQTTGGRYDLLVTRSNNNGERDFLNRNVSIEAKDTHFVNYSSWVF